MLDNKILLPVFSTLIIALAHIVLSKILTLNNSLIIFIIAIALIIIYVTYIITYKINNIIPKRFSTFNQGKNIPQYLRNINNEAAEIFEFKKLFRNRYFPELKEAIRIIYGNNKPGKISASDLRRYIYYVKVKNREIDIGMDSILSLTYMSIIFIYFEIIIGLFFVEFSRQTYFKLLTVRELLLHFNWFFYGAAFLSILTSLIVIAFICYNFIYSSIKIYHFKKALVEYYNPRSLILYYQFLLKGAFYQVIMLIVFVIFGMIFFTALINSPFSPPKKINLIPLSKYPNNIQAKIYFNGNDFRGISRNPRKAIKLWKKSAEEHLNFYSQFNLGYIYATDKKLRNFCKSKLFLAEVLINPKANLTVKNYAVEYWNRYELQDYNLQNNICREQ